VNEYQFMSKMKECPSCGNKEFPNIPNMDTNYFFFGVKETDLDKLKSMNPADYFSKLTDFVVLPFTCSKCGFTVLQNRVWKFHNENQDNK